ncbi:hypothetical protein EMCRGX_G009029 [Ephydatia muelleri]
MMAEVQQSHRPHKTKAAFGSVSERLMMPYHPPHSRAGIEQCLRGAPNRGPGCYDPPPVRLFLSQLDKRPRSKRGCFFGATSGTRLQIQRKVAGPGPADYDRSQQQHVRPSYKPFDISIPRLPEIGGASTPGPGAYGHDEPRNRHIEFEEAFGGKKTLKKSVVVKCTKGVPDICSSCHKEPIGDYFECGSSILCADCFQPPHHGLSPDPHVYHKVRDCKAVHRHELPGAEPKTILRTEKEERRLRHREAYMRLYYSSP